MSRTESSGYDRRTWSVAPVLSTAAGRLRRNPTLFVPFALAGFVLSVIDVLRSRDPIPTLVSGGLDKATVYLEFVGYPTATSQTVLPFEALVGLKPQYFAWGLGLYVLSMLAIAVAGVLTLTALLDGEAHLGPLPSYLGLVVGFDLAARLLGSIAFLQGMGLWGVIPLALVLFVLVWLFPAPGLVAAGASPLTAIRQSGVWIRGDRWPALGLIIILGIGAWLLGSVPVAGTFLTGVLVAPVHAVALVSLFEYRRNSELIVGPSKP
ncbi:hypothetical protein [Natrialba taiwanensis]|uniref:Uncharacterized protein n=1 Tax=Natrialba taiwanensis DSM 12281 TaxID=1230458 RepID=M0A7K5_9EURY|nr:hypothetical protein [Natrialba taiwanensis]ELY94494.1 hypothetical protein C484_05947 [Natrialba taiwanensis DSM 12281]